MKVLNFLLSALEHPSASWILAVVFIVYMHKMHQRQLEDRQNELDRLAADNRACRDRTERLYDRIEKTLFSKNHRKR